MTKRERYLKALTNQRVDQLVWAPNFDYWLQVNTAEGTVPEKFRGLSRNDIVRAIGGYIWNRASAFREVLDKSIAVDSVQDGTDWVYSYTTPIGSIRSVSSIAEGEHRGRFLKEHFVKDLDSLKVMRYVVEGTHYEPDYEPCIKAVQETGEDGIVLNMSLCVPFIQYAKTDAGYINGFYLWTDHREEVDKLIAAYTDLFLQGYQVLAEGPADVISTGDNMDGTTISPSLFREYAIPFYQQAREILARKGKIFEGHWCGRTQTLLDMVPGCGLDVVEAIVSKPMADISIEEVIERLRGEVVVQGGVPSVLVCQEGGSRDDFVRYMQETIVPLKGRQSFILGMSDNVPPNADFERIEMIAGLIE